MDWREHYKRCLRSSEEAVSVIKSGDRIVSAHACSEPIDLYDALVARAPELRDVEVVHLVPMGKGEYARPEYAGSFRHNSVFVGAPTREAVCDGRADFTPCHFHETPALFTEGYLPPDVALVHLSPPDRHGWCSFGLSVDYTKPAALAARKIVAQVNPNMPRTHGDTFIHVTRLDAIVESSTPLLELPAPRIGAVAEAIGRNISELVRDGDCLQVGIGAIPEAVLRFLHDKKDLGIHSEMFSDGVVDLYEEGVVTNSRKTIHRDRLVATFLMGSRRLYDFVDDNPVVSMFPVSYTNNPYVIAQNDNVVSINSALQVDLMGQVVADTMGPRQYTGVGGQVDFVRGAAASKGGRAIIALPSTAKCGTVSRIVAKISDGAAVTTMRADVDYVVTEHGVAHLKGKTLRERRRELLAIAQPEFRGLIEEDYGALCSAETAPSPASAGG
jgi:4-hydroxybutyrate CoA-transferase